MATEIYLGYPSQHVIDWIRNHSQPTQHEETWYKYAGDTEWKKVMLSGTIALVDSEDQSTGQIENPYDIVAIEIGTGTQANPVTSIGNAAFFDCWNLKSVSIPSTVISIGHNAFYSCGITSVTVPGSVQSIGQNLFQACDYLANATIENGVKSIGDGMFVLCSGLTSVTIPDSVTSIGESAFSYCSVLPSVTIPNSVTSIGNSAFFYCSGLTSVTFLGKTMEQVKKMDNYYYDWGIEDESIINVA